jgi:hypothetical protein
MNEHDSTFVFEKITKHFDQKLPFVVYNKPNAKKIIGVFQADDVLYHVENYTEAGFVFAPFDGNEIVLIPKNQSQIVLADVAGFIRMLQVICNGLKWMKMKTNQTSRISFKKALMQFIKAISEK